MFQYARCWKQWVEFCQQYGISEYTSDETHALAYLAFVAKNFSNGVSTAYAHQSSIAYHYRIRGRPSVTDAHKVQMYMRGICFIICLFSSTYPMENLQV